MQGRAERSATPAARWTGDRVWEFEFTRAVPVGIVRAGYLPIRM